MKYSTTALSKLFEHRYKFDASIYNIQRKEFRKITIFLDTGCFNTMLPRYLAERSGHSLGFKMTYSIGGNIWEMIISKKAHSFQFREDPPENLPNKTNIYQNYFNRDGNYICVQEN